MTSRNPASERPSCKEAGSRSSCKARLDSVCYVADEAQGGRPAIYDGLPILPTWITLHATRLSTWPAGSPNRLHCKVLDQPSPAIVALIDSMRYRRMLRLILGPLGVSRILYHYCKIKTFSGMCGINRCMYAPGPLRHQPAIRH